MRGVYNGAARDRQQILPEIGTTNIMATPSTLELLKLLADDTRWQLISELRQSDRQVGELVAQLQLPQNLVSYHLGVLRQAGLVHVRRSDADARVTYYGLDIERLQSVHQQIGADLQLPQLTASMEAPSATVIFLCTGNSARSQMAEGWLRHLSGGRVLARSAGVQPRSLHPLAVEVMAEAGIDIGYQRAKSPEALASMRPDVVVTVCDLARERCPEWPGKLAQLHWSIPDPVRVQGDRTTELGAFRTASNELHARVQALLASLPTLAPTGSS
jgi:ArsR family transcriptional regulator, arsenate/arsenite/antimonite-responsive transcriptional repressor / arsenate reductase (thioredoxin)